jgi:hypothetical protein
MNQRTSQGFVLAFHCVHWDVEPAIENFWRQLRKRLKDQGQELLLVSTVPLHDTELPFLGIPFHLPDFGLQTTTNTIATNNPRMASVLQDWSHSDRPNEFHVILVIFHLRIQLLDQLKA